MDNVIWLDIHMWEDSQARLSFLNIFLSPPPLQPPMGPKTLQNDAFSTTWAAIRKRTSWEWFRDVEVSRTSSKLRHDSAITRLKHACPTKGVEIRTRRGGNRLWRTKLTWFRETDFSHEGSPPPNEVSRPRGGWVLGGGESLARLSPQAG